jgi:hypothetical protein
MNIDVEEAFWLLTSSLLRIVLSPPQRIAFKSVRRVLT